MFIVHCYLNCACPPVCPWQRCEARRPRAARVLETAIAGLSEWTRRSPDAQRVRISLRMDTSRSSWNFQT